MPYIPYLALIGCLVGQALFFSKKNIFSAKDVVDDLNGKNSKSYFATLVLDEWMYEWAKFIDVNYDKVVGIKKLHYIEFSKVEGKVVVNAKQRSSDKSSIIIKQQKTTIISRFDLDNIIKKELPSSLVVDLNELAKYVDVDNFLMENNIPKILKTKKKRKRNDLIKKKSKRLKKKNS